MKYTPREIPQNDVTWGAALDILPKWSDIPDDFKRDSNPWARWQSDWFFSGLKKYPKPKEGINLQLAMKNLHACQMSWEPKHEHKQAGVAYLASLWFESPDGDPIKLESKQ